MKNPSRNLSSNRTKVKILKKKNFLYISQKKFGSAYAQSPRKCSNIEILAKIEGKEAKFYSKFYEGHIRIWFRSKKKFEIISCLCTFKRIRSLDTATNPCRGQVSGFGNNASKYSILFSVAGTTRAREFAHWQLRERSQIARRRNYKLQEGQTAGEDNGKCSQKLSSGFEKKLLNC